MELNLNDNNGDKFNLTEYQGNSFLLLVFFRGAWCNHCKKQLQEIEQHLADFTHLNTKIIALSSDTPFNSSLVKSFLKLSFPVLADNQFTLIDSFGLRTIYKDKEVAKPAVYLFNPAGDVLFNYIGKDYDDRLSAKQLLEIIPEHSREL